MQLSFFEQFLKLASRLIGVSDRWAAEELCDELPQGSFRRNRQPRPLKGTALSPLGSPLMQSFPTARKLFPALFDTSWRTVTTYMRWFLLVHFSSSKTVSLKRTTLSLQLTCYFWRLAIFPFHYYFFYSSFLYYIFYYLVFPTPSYVSLLMNYKLIAIHSTPCCANAIILFVLTHRMICFVLSSDIDMSSDAYMLQLYLTPLLILINNMHMVACPTEHDTLWLFAR